MNYMSESERLWAKENGLKKTNLRTMVRCHQRIVYRARDGRLFYRDRNQYVGTFREYCYESN